MLRHFSILIYLGCHLGLFEALLEPPSGIFDAPTAGAPPRPGPAEGSIQEPPPTRTICIRFGSRLATPNVVLPRRSIIRRSAR